MIKDDKYQCQECKWYSKPTFPYCLGDCKLFSICPDKDFFCAGFEKQGNITISIILAMLHLDIERIKILKQEIDSRNRLSHTAKYRREYLDGQITGLNIAMSTVRSLSAADKGASE